eukprot:5840769-Pyramimonas_sp.AAC.1
MLGGGRGNVEGPSGSMADRKGTPRERLGNAEGLSRSIPSGRLGTESTLADPQGTPRERRGKGTPREPPGFRVDPWPIPKERLGNA